MRARTRTTSPTRESVARGIPDPSDAVVFGGKPLTLHDIADIARGAKKATLNPSKQFHEKIRKSAAFVESIIASNQPVYGITTGYGDSCTVRVPSELIEELPVHLTRFHGCGLGDYFDASTSRAILGTRLASLAQGYSGVRLELLDQLVAFINHGITPRIPEEGSVGASGDLTPLSYVAAALMGERAVAYRGEIRDAREVLDQIGLSPIRLRPKESLAVMNGTAVMTALACLAHRRADYLVRLTTRISALVCAALKGNVEHFDEFLHSLKPHGGSVQVAAWISDDLRSVEGSQGEARIQEPYSIRCAPQIIGVLEDALVWMAEAIEIELNSANDNPIIDAAGGRILHGGHFYGGHIAFVMDSMKIAVANLADLMDRQLALLMDVKFNQGLPPNLSGASPARLAINHGFKAVQIGVSAWTGEALKHTMPASVFSRSTECHNQDKVSMGTIAARDCIRVLQLTEQVAAASLLAAMQALEIRIRKREIDESSLSPSIRAMRQQIFERFAFLEEDRPIEQSLREFIELIQSRAWLLYEQ